MDPLATHEIWGLVSCLGWGKVGPGVDPSKRRMERTIFLTIVGHSMDYPHRARHAGWDVLR